MGVEVVKSILAVPLFLVSIISHARESYLLNQKDCVRHMQDSLQHFPASKPIISGAVACEGHSDHFSA